MSPLPNPWLGDVAGGPSWLLRGFTGEISVRGMGKSQGKRGYWCRVSERKEDGV